MKITVLYGGPSAEREVSLVSGKAVADALKSVGHDVLLHDIQPSDLSILDQPADVIFPVLHGQWGESGELQEILESRNLKFVGSSAQASRLGMDKVATKKAWEAAGLPTPRYAVVSSNQVPFNGPCVVKAIASGSSIDVYLCRTGTETLSAIHAVVRKHGRALVEQFIDGSELTVGLLEEQPLAPIRIVSNRAFFDYEAKYRAADTEHRFDTGLPQPVIEQCRTLARKANQVIGARDLSRVDIMLDNANRPFLLEINTLPGFTPKSLLPEAAAHAGIPFGALVDRLAQRAFSRR